MRLLTLLAFSFALSSSAAFAVPNCIKDTPKRASCSASAPCVVTVTLVNDKLHVTPYDLDVDKSARDVPILWVGPANGVFEPAQQHGTFFKKPRGQFSDSEATDDPPTAVSPAASSPIAAKRAAYGKNFRWRFAGNLADRYEYKIVVSVGGKTYSCHPFINNDAAD